VTEQVKTTEQRPSACSAEGITMSTDKGKPEQVNADFLFEETVEITPTSRKRTRRWRFTWRSVGVLMALFLLADAMLNLFLNLNRPAMGNDPPSMRHEL
jgi:hypothetical protein